MPLLGAHAKALVALIMAVLGILDVWFDVSIGGLSEPVVSAIIFAATPLIVWLVPNRGS